MSQTPKVRFTFTADESDLTPDAMDREVPESNDLSAWADIIAEAFGVPVTVERIEKAV